MESKNLLTPRVLVLASGNHHKLREFEQLLSPLGLRVTSADTYNLKLPPEPRATDGGTFEKNARLKAEFVCQATGEMTLADDSGLCVDALGGLPGVDSAFFGGAEHLLAALDEKQSSDRSARFVCVLALTRPGLETLFFEGTCEGVIPHEMRGQNGFHFDPVFRPLNSSKTFAEMEAAEKDDVSHRRMAVNKLLDWWKASHA